MINYRKLPSDRLFAVHSSMNERLLYFLERSKGTYKPEMWIRKINLLMKARKKYAYKPMA